MKRVFSGVQPTNNLHLGNYLGAIKNWVELQNSYDAFYCVVDLHAITVKQDPKQLRQNVLNVAKTYLALGVDPDKSTIFVQSHVPQHAELAWVLNTIAKLSELERMTQFKDKAKEHKENINMGLFDYPVLMASDILLYSPEVVPVGEDQKQHVELTRDLAARFNSLYGKTFIEPKPLINKEGARIMGLDDPTKKMSKSAASANSYIALLDSPEVVAKKISRAVTDSGTTIESGADRPALTNLLTIYSLLSNQSIKNIEKEYAGKGYADFKKGLAQVVTQFISEFQSKFNALDDNKVKKILEEGAAKAKVVAEKKMEEVKTKMGLL
ncbi:MAG: tryptophan--tRNA ligase [Candidatus Magasanikbacteria bacterium]|nr:tryptophan--tRNA ligase [Candidatus Magasanikbacteria bacterium]